MTSSVILAGARTPIGKFGGGFKDLPAVKLGASAIQEALARAGVPPDQVDYVIMGQVIQAGAGQITARQAAILAGIPREIPAITIVHLETQSALNPLGVKGVGEAGTIPVPALVAEAVDDALAPFGVRVREMPLSPTRIRELIAAGTGAGGRR